MLPQENLQQFYSDKLSARPNGLDEITGHFNVFRIEECAAPGMPPFKYTRKDFYKLCLIRGRNRYHYADKSIELNGPTLIFFNPFVPYSWEPLEPDVSGYFCLFTKTFIDQNGGAQVTSLPMYEIGGKLAYQLGADEEEHVSYVFKRMYEEVQSDYALKNDLIRNYITELSHFALKAEPSETLYQHPDARSRLTTVFTALLERQFPVPAVSARFTMRYPKDFADQLAVHVNSLNRAVKEITGKTTSEFIAERIICEAKILLKYSDMNISEISFALGFDEPSHFNTVFKRIEKCSPSTYRAQKT